MTHLTSRPAYLCFPDHVVLRAATSPLARELPLMPCYYGLERIDAEAFFARQLIATGGGLVGSTALQGVKGLRPIGMADPFV